MNLLQNAKYLSINNSSIFFLFFLYYAGMYIFSNKTRQLHLTCKRIRERVYIVDGEKFVNYE